MKPRLLISFSGGRTSAFMTYRILQTYAAVYDTVVVFANTGQENEATLKFIHDCDTYLGFNTVWVEAVTFPGQKKSAGHVVVTYETANRDGAPFEAVVAKYGIANTTHPHCTRELKQKAIESYARSIAWDDYLTAIGIRTDENRRVSKTATDRQIVYPLLDWFPSDKIDVNDFWEDMFFNLQLQEHEGNCKWCWKKSFGKHARLLQETPDIYDFPRRMEGRYGMVGPAKEHREHPDAFPRTWFRENTSTAALRQKVIAIKPWRAKDPDPDVNGGCTESCEVYQTEPVA